MIKAWRLPTRNCRDSDTLALILLAGGILALKESGIAEQVIYIWKAFGVICLLTALPLWIRMPYAKWGGIVASLLFATVPILHSVTRGFSLTSLAIVLGSIWIATWYYQIDYDHIHEGTRGEE